MIFNIAGTKFDVEPVQFDDITYNDQVIHLVEGFGDEDLLWMGTATHPGTVTEEWYGAGRMYASRRAVPHDEPESVFFGTEFPTARQDDRPDVLVVAKWHTTETNHSVYRVK